MNRSVVALNVALVAGALLTGPAQPASAAPPSTVAQIQVLGTGHSIYSGPVSIDTTLTGGTYYMIDPSHGNNRTCDASRPNCPVFTDADNIWGTGSATNKQSAAVDAHYAAALTYDYFKFVHGRNGIFGDGRGITSRVHYGVNYANAFWDGTQMIYGDGAAGRPPVSVDIAGHEMTHGVTDHTAGLVYSGESGGLNEATSDIFATMIEFYANNPYDPGDYLIGEKFDLFGNGTPLRWMYNPALDGSSDSCWSTSTKTKHPRYSSGVGNHFFFMLAEGSGATPYGTSPVCGSAPAVTGIGRARAEKIWFRALKLYFTSNTVYVNAANPGNTARAATLRAATDLYGNCSTEYKAVQAAWTAVNVAGSDPACMTDTWSMSISPTFGTVTPGASTTATVITSTNSGWQRTVNLSAAGAPPGTTVTFNPPSITTGQSSVMTITTSATTPIGFYQITVIGAGDFPTRTLPYTLTVADPGGSS